MMERENELVRTRSKLEEAENYIESQEKRNNELMSEIREYKTKEVSKQAESKTENKVEVKAENKIESKMESGQSLAAELERSRSELRQLSEELERSKSEK